MSQWLVMLLRKKNMQVTATMAQWIGARTDQQDCMSVFHPNSTGIPIVMFIVADGVGGNEGGRESSTLAVRSIKEHAANLASLGDAAYLTMIAAANRALHTLKFNRMDLSNAATTLLIAGVKSSRLSWISIGDSPLYLIRQRKLTRLNADHSRRAEFDVLVRKGMMTQENARTDPRSNQLTSALTGEPVGEVDMSKKGIRLNRGDKIVAATDGLSTLTDHEILTVLGDGCADDLVTACKTKNKPNQDNVSVVVADVE